MSLSLLDDYLTKNEMFDFVYVYQKDAIEWMYDRISKHKGCLLCDEMGLGKTLDIAILFQIVLPKLALLIAPTSCIYTQWVRNLCKYSFYYKIYVLQSNKIKQVILNEEDNIIESDLYEIMDVMMNDPHPYKIIISNFHGIKPYPSITGSNGKTAGQIETQSPLDEYIPELTPLNNLVFDMVVVDEIHKIRNGVNTRLDPGEARKKMLMFHRLSRIRMTPNYGIRIGLTGTPIQNRISDVVSILTFVGVEFPPRVSENQVKAAIREYMFRRAVEDLHPAIRSLINYPEVDYVTIVKNVVYESQAEADVYRIVAGCLTGQNVHGSDRNNPYSQVKFECNPLIRVMRECYLSADINMFITIHNNAYQMIKLPEWPGTQSKINMIVDDLVLLSLENESLIIYIHFYAERAAILERMYYKGLELGLGKTLGYTIFDINGDIEIKDRDGIIKDTKVAIEKGIKNICFCTIQSSSDGLNLQHYNIGMFSTSDWNPANEDQSIARMYRIGQKKLVRIYRYIHNVILEMENECVDHIDVYKLKKQDVKKGKFESYITNVPNAAFDWPIRDVPGFDGEKSVTFKDYEKFQPGYMSPGMIEIGFRPTLTFSTDYGNVFDITDTLEGFKSININEPPPNPNSSNQTIILPPPPPSFLPPVPILTKQELRRLRINKLSK